MSTPRAQSPSLLHAISPRLLPGSFPPNSVVIVIIVCITSTPCERRFFFEGARVIRVLSSRYAHTSARIVIGIFGIGIGVRLAVGRSGLTIQGDYAALTFTTFPGLTHEMDIPRLSVELKEALDLLTFVRSTTVYITVIVWRPVFGVRRSLITKTVRSIWWPP